MRGNAFIQYAEQHYTKNFVRWIGTLKTNSIYAYRSRIEFGASLKGLAEKDFSEDGFLLNQVPGGNFNPSLKNRNIIRFDKFKIPFISQEDLIEIKKTSGGDQDSLGVKLFPEKLNHHDY